MVPAGSDYPDVGDYVVCTVKNVKDFGAFVILDEFGKEGFIHITEVATGWVKYIRDYVREGQKIVCKVIKIDPKKGYIDLSLKQISEHQKREKISEWKNNQKALKLIEFVVKEVNLPEREVITYIDSLVEVFGNLYAAFENAKNNPNAILETVNNKAFADAFCKIASENIIAFDATISSILSIQFISSDGISLIKEVMLKSENVDKNVKIRYVGGGKYRIQITAKNYKKAELTLKNIIDMISNYVKVHKGSFSFQRED